MTDRTEAVPRLRRAAVGSVAAGVLLSFVATTAQAPALADGALPPPISFYPFDDESSADEARADGAATLVGFADERCGIRSRHRRGRHLLRRRDAVRDGAAPDRSWRCAADRLHGVRMGEDHCVRPGPLVRRVPESCRLGDDRQELGRSGGLVPSGSGRDQHVVEHLHRSRERRWESDRWRSLVGSRWRSQASGSRPQAAEWVHVVSTVSSTDLRARLYVNGVEQTSAAGGTSPARVPCRQRAQAAGSRRRGRSTHVLRGQAQRRADGSSGPGGHPGLAERLPRRDRVLGRRAHPRAGPPHRAGRSRRHVARRRDGRSSGRHAGRHADPAGRLHAGPVRAGEVLTCVVSGGPSDAEILWSLTVGDLQFGAGLMLDQDGAGVFTVAIPRSAPERTPPSSSWSGHGPVDARCGRWSGAGECPCGEGAAGALLLAALVSVAGAVLVGRRVRCCLSGCCSRCTP
jgi:hypothetical protein